MALARIWIPVRDSAGEEYLVATRNLVRAKLADGESKLVEILVREPVNDKSGRIVAYELNTYYVKMTLAQFEGAYS